MLDSIFHVMKITLKLHFFLAGKRYDFVIMYAMLL